MRSAMWTAVAALMLVVATSGCTTYYRITDPASGKKYYTDDFKRTDAGVRFKDHVSRSEVTLPASEVLEVEKEEYKKNTEKK